MLCDARTVSHNWRDTGKLGLCDLHLRLNRKAQRSTTLLTRIVVNFLALAQIKLFDVQPDSQVLQFISFSFDASIGEIVMAVLYGASTLFRTREELQPWTTFAATITKVQDYPSYSCAVRTWRCFAEEDCQQFATILVRREALPANSDSLLARWAEDDSVQCYGPTESTIWRLLFRFDGGWAVANWSCDC